MKKQQKQLVILVIVLLLLVAGYFGAQKYSETQRAKEAEEVSIYAIDLLSSDVTEMSYTNGEEEYAFVLEDGVWKYKEDKELSLIQSRLETMVNNVAKVAIESQIENVTDLSEYGLEEPKQVITFTAGGKGYEIAVGDFNSLSALDYICIDGSDVVYAVETTLSDAFDYTLEELIEEVEEETETTTEEAVTE